MLHPLFSILFHVANFFSLAAEGMEWLYQVKSCRSFRLLGLSSICIGDSFLLEER